MIKIAIITANNAVLVTRKGGNQVILYYPQEVADALREKKILIKTFGNEFLKKYVRISTGSKKAMRYFLDAFLEVDK